VDRTEVLRAHRLLVQNGAVTELRVLNATLRGSRYPGIVSGYFDSGEKLADAAALVVSALGFYIVPNLVDPDAIGRATNRLRMTGKHDPLTSAGDMRRRVRLLIDFDPVRPSGTSSTDDQHEAAVERARVARDWLRGQGWPDPLMADSGNGGHLDYGIDLPIEDDGLVKVCLAALAARFDDQVVVVDTEVFDANRIWRLYGTRACKGDASEERPHRMSRIIEAPDELVVVPDALLRSLAGLEPAAAVKLDGPPAYLRDAGRGRGTEAARANAAPSFDLADWIKRYVADAEGPSAWQGSGTIWKIPTCPFDASHVGGSAYVGRLPKGTIIAGCHHSSCKDWGWKELRDLREPAALRAARTGQSGPSRGVVVFSPVTAADLVRDYPVMHEPVIEGLLRVGEILNVIAGPKVGKSWLVHWLIIAVALGLDWLGMRTRKGRVLLIDGELHKPTLAARLKKMTTDRKAEKALDDIEVWAVRGQRLTIDDIEAALSKVTPGAYSMIVLDALYRFLPLDGEENANETMTHIYNTLDAIAERLQACIVVVHHASKGDQSQKAVTDMGSGAGAQSRATDSHLVLRAHEEEDAVVVEAAVRTWKKPEPFVICWCDPGWELDTEGLDPALLRKPKPRKPRYEAEETPKPPPRIWTPEEFANEVVGATPLIKDEVIARANKAAVNKTQAEALLKRALADRMVFIHRDGHSSPQRYGTREPELFSPSPAGEGQGVVAPTAPERSARGGAGGDTHPPPPPPSAPSPTPKPRRWSEWSAGQRRAFPASLGAVATKGQDTAPGSEAWEVAQAVAEGAAGKPKKRRAQSLTSGLPSRDIPASGVEPPGATRPRGEA